MEFNGRTMTALALFELLGGGGSLDDIAWGGKTYREIFLNGNMFSEVSAITETSNDSWSQFSTLAKPTPTTEHYNTSPSAWNCSGSTSVQMSKDISLPIGNAFYIACKRKLASYTAGNWLGVEVYYINGAGRVISDTVDANSVSETFQTVSHTFTPKTETTQFWIGSGGSADLIGYIDDVVCVNMTELFGEDVPTKDEMNTLYENFLRFYNGGGGSKKPTLQSKAVTPSEDAQTVTPDSGYDGLSSVAVDAISRNYVGSGVMRKSAQTYTPSTSDQTIAAGQYLNGAQTIAGDADLVAGNIKKGVSIFGVTGTLETGSDPALQSKIVSPSTSQQTVNPDAGYDGLSQVTVNAIPTATQATPTISVSADGLITAIAEQMEGYVAAGTMSGTKQLATKSAATYTPSTSDQTIAPEQYLTGAQTIKGDANLKAENIAEGVSIFGVLGKLASGGGTSGGGLPAGVSAIDYGTFTLSSDATTQTNVVHNLGAVPDFAIWWLDSAHIATATTTVAVRGVVLNMGINATLNTQYSVGGYNGSGKGGVASNTVAGEYSMTKNGFTARCSSTYPILAGLTYHWIAGTLNFVA